MIDDYEPWPRAFESAAHAVSWADNYLSGAGERNLSQLGAEVRGRNRSQSLPEVDRYGALVTSTRLQDQAETISVALSACDNPGGVLYRHVHGRHNRTIEIADQLAHLVWDGPANGKTIGRMRAVALMLIHRYQTEQKTFAGGVSLQLVAENIDVPWDELSLQLIAKNIDVPWDEFRKYWFPYVITMTDHLKAWMARAERQLEQDLADKRIL